MKYHPPFHEFSFETTRSSGAGGQHVNKTESAVILRWNARTTTLFSELDYHRVLMFLSRNLTKDGELLIKSSDSRSQKQNKDTCIEKWLALITKALKPQIKRVATKPTHSSKRKRLTEKKHQSQTKTLRAKVGRSED